MKTQIVLTNMPALMRTALILAILSGAIPADGATSSVLLDKAIQQTRQQVQSEQQRFQAESRTREQALTQLRAEQERLAQELIERKLAVARKQAELAQHRSQRESLWSQQFQWQDDRAEIKLICSEAQRELSEWIQDLPPSELRSEQRQALEQLQEALTGEHLETALTSLFSLLDSLLTESRSTALYEGDITDPQGQKQHARLLRIGQSLYAYAIPGSPHVAMAVSAPNEQAGFRWMEDLDKTTRQTLTAVLVQSTNQPDKPALQSLRFDVTGRMSAGSTDANKTILDRLRSGGVVMIPLALVALWLVLLIIERAFVLLLESRHSTHFCQTLLNLCSRGCFAEAENLAGSRKSIISRTLKVCLKHRQSPREVLDDALQESFLHEFPKLERFLPSIRMLASVAPMLGLLGTVTGMITTFDMITLVGSGRPRLMAGGISEALITTAAGLTIAIPALLSHSLLSGKVERIIADTERFAASLSNLISGADNRRPFADT